jgi:hypothetical protein
LVLSARLSFGSVVLSNISNADVQPFGSVPMKQVLLFIETSSLDNEIDNPTSNFKWSKMQSLVSKDVKNKILLQSVRPLARHNASKERLMAEFQGSMVQP